MIAHLARTRKKYRKPHAGLFCGTRMECDPWRNTPVESNMPQVGSRRFSSFLLLFAALGIYYLREGAL